MQIYKMLYNATVTYVDLTLKIHSTFINETVKVLQIQLIEHSSNTKKYIQKNLNDTQSCQPIT